MTRIISGFAGSLGLKVPRSGTRPTSDRTREGIFSALEARGALDGAEVLDLYSGSGALGLEAVSRGARLVRLVDHASDAASTGRANIATVLAAAPTGASIDAQAVTSAVLPYLARTAHRFDLVFIDPPYDLGEQELTDVLGALASHVSTEAELVVERSTRSPEPTWGPGQTLRRRRDYGETAVYYVDADPID
ncbi:MAG: RsmD family RNA methyltransferase [Naasia sp.]